MSPALLLAALLATSAVPDGPMAVMPFKNLNADPSLEWLRRGMAETMISDLKSSGKTSVVEREQLDKALAEIELQGSEGSEERTAAKVGKLTGAKTIIVGSFQEAGKELRINARFVTVETGVICGVAKATGPVKNVFLLQDQIIGNLLGVQPKAVVKARPRKTTDQTFKAYKLYAMALTTASDADKVGYLKQALSEDPDFTYATEELEALRKRLGQLEERSERAFQSTSHDLETALDDPALTPQERATQATLTLGKLAATFHYTRLKALARHVMDLHLPAAPGGDPTEIAHFYLFLSEHTLKQTDLALKTGETFLERYPTSMYFMSVETQMRSMIKERQDREQFNREVDGKLAELETERASQRAKLAARPDTLETVERSLDFRRCSELYRMKQEKRAIETCNAFADKWRKSDGASYRFVPDARWMVVMSYTDLGDFAKAREVAKKLVDDEPEFARSRSLETLINTWPRD